MLYTNRKVSCIPEPAGTPGTGQVSNATGEGESMDIGTTYDDDASVSDGRQKKCLCRGSWKKKNTISIGTWNMRTMNELGKLDLLIDELGRHKMNITGLCETRWEGEGIFQHRDHAIIFCGSKGEKGVAIILDEHFSSCIRSHNTVNDRMVIVKLNTKPTPTNIIQVYAPTSTSTEEEIERFYEQLQSEKDRIPSREVCIIMGDLNAKVGNLEDRERGIGPYGLGERNERGDMLADFCQANSMSIMNTMFKQPERRRYTWISPGDLCRNQIDYIIIDNAWKTSILDAKTRPGADCDTDHILVKAKLRIKAFKQPKKKRPPRYDLELLKESETEKSYQVELQNRFDALDKDWSANENCPEIIWDTMKKIYTETADKILPRIKKKTNKPFISEEVRKLAVEKSNARKKNNMEEYKRLKKEIRRKIRRDKNNWLEEECAKITNANIDRKSKEVYNQIKKVTTPNLRPQNVAIKNKNGETLSEMEDVLSRWHEYGQELFHQSKNFLNEQADDTAQHQDPEPKPLLREVEQAVRQLKDGKSPGLDNIPAELLKHSGEMGMKMLHKLCCKIWSTRSWPSDWKTQEFVMLYKNGDPKDCGNYRTIALISHASKVMLIIILNRLKIQIEHELSDCQAGYRSDRGTRDMLFVLQIMFEKVRNCNSEAYITFIDYSKAFDSVIHQHLFYIMRQMGFSNHLVSLTQQLYNNQKATIRWNGQHSPTFDIEKGVRQGCILSPHLFNLYTEQIMRNSDIDDMGIKIGGRNITNLRYADDTALISDNITSLKRILHRVDTVGKEAGLSLNAKKTKVMHIGKEKREIAVKINGIELEQVQDFKYLGSMKSSDGTCTKDVKIRIGMAKKKMLSLNNIWKDNNIPMSLKLHILKSLIWPVVMYGCEAWSLKAQDEKRISACEMWLYRRLLRIKWSDKVTNEKVLEAVDKNPEMLQEIKKRKLKYVGHVVRHGKTDLMAAVLQGRVEGRRNRGRPAVSYMSNLKADTGMSIQSIMGMARDRQRWKDYVQQHCGDHQSVMPS